MKLELLQTRVFVGRVEWIGIASERRGQVESVQAIEAVAGMGLSGEHHGKSGQSKRQVTLFQHEYLSVIANLLRRSDVAPEALRRNIVVSGINLASLREQRFHVGEVVLKGTGDCPPCARMEETLGTGGYAAMIAHGGITAAVVSGGSIKVGDRVILQQVTNV